MKHKKAVVAQSKYRCYMNAATRKRYGVSYVGKLSTPTRVKASYHGHRSRKSVFIEIYQAPLTVSRLLQTLGREDILFLDKEAMEALGCKPGCRVEVVT